MCSIKNVVNLMFVSEDLATNKAVRNLLYKNKLNASELIFFFRNDRKNTLRFFKYTSISAGTYVLFYTGKQKRRAQRHKVICYRNV